MADEGSAFGESSRPGTTAEDLKAYMAPFAERLGYKFNTDTDFVDMVLEGELEILEQSGDVYCPCRVRSGDPKEDAQIVCPCIPFFRDQFAGMTEVLVRPVHTRRRGGRSRPARRDRGARGGAGIEVPVARVEDLPPGQGFATSR